MVINANSLLELSHTYGIKRVITILSLKGIVKHEQSI